MVALHGLAKLGRILVFAFTGLLVIACVAVFSSRLQVNAELKRTIEAVASQNAGLAITVGQVRGQWWSGLTLHDVQVHGTADPASPVVISAPIVQASYQLTAFFGAVPTPIRVDVYHPDVRIKVQADRLMNIRPRMRIPHDDLPAEPVQPIDFVLHGGHLSYGDDSARQPFVVEVGRVTGTGTIRGFDLAVKIQALHEADVIRADATYDLKALRGGLDLTADGLDLSYWVNRFAFAREYHMLAGEADVRARLDWQDPLIMDELRLAGTAKVRGGKLQLKNVAVPLEDLAGVVSFDQNAVTLPKLTASLAGMPIEIAGKVRDILVPAPYLGYPDQLYQVKVTAPAIDLAKLSTPWPGLKSLGLGGHGKIIATVSGRASNPLVAMVGTVPAGQWGKETLGDVRIDGRYVTGRLDLPSFSGTVAGGKLQGSTYVGLPPGEHDAVPYRVDIAFDGLRLPVLLDHYLEEPLLFPVDGRLHGTYRLTGADAKNVAVVAAKVVGGTIDAKPVQAASFTWTAAGGKWAMPDAQLRWGRTHADFVIDGRDGGDFNLAFKLPQGDLRDLMYLNPEPPKTPVTGTLVGEGSIHGNFDKPTGWTGQLGFKVPEGHVWREKFDKGEATAHFADNQIVIDKAVGRFLKGEVRASGTYGPVIAKRTVEAFTKLDIKLHELDLGAIKALPPKWRDLRGRAQGRIAYVGRTKHYDAAGQVSAARVRHPRWGELEKLRASVIMTTSEVALLPATWTQRGETIRATGTISTPEIGEPVLNLRIKADQADVKTLSDAIRWAEVVEQVAPTNVAAKAIGPERPLGELPARGEIPIRQAMNQLQLGDQLAHWQAHRKAPAGRVPDAPVLLPFWEEARGKLTLDARVVGPVSAPVADVEMQLVGTQLLGRPLELVEARLVASKDVVRVGMARVREAGRTVLTLGGAIRVSSFPSVIADNARETLVIRAHGLDLTWLDPLLVRKQIKLVGKAEGLVRLRGPFKAPRVEAEGGLSAGTFAMPGVAPIVFDDVRADLAFEQGRLWLNRATVRQQGREATVAGSIPVDARALGPQAPIDLALKLEDANLGIVNLVGGDKFRWLGGKGKLDLKVSGTMAHPSLAGRIDVREGRFEARGLDGPVEDFAADVVLDDEKVDVRALNGRYGGGGFELGGQVFWEQFEPRRVDLTAHARPFRLRTPDGTYTGMIEARVKLAGAVAAPVLSGQVSLWDGVVRIRDQVAKAADGPAPPPLKLSGLEVTLGPNLFVRNALMDVSVTTLQRQGKLSIEGTVAAPKPRGTVIVESGTITPLNNPFKISEGRVDFLGENVGADSLVEDILGDAASGRSVTGLNGRLDVRARSAVYDYQENETVDITAHVTGSLDRMEMRFTSLPMRSEQEVLDILSKKQVLAGTFSGKLDRGEVIVKEVGGFVTSNLEELVSPLTLRLRNMMNLQTLRFELVTNYEKTSITDLAGFRPALTLETRPLFERLSLGSRLVAGEFYDTSPNTGNDSTYASMNFRLNRRLSVEYRVDPYVDPRRERVLNQTLGLRAQVGF